MSGGGAPSSVDADGLLMDWPGEKPCLARAPGLRGSSQVLLEFPGAPR